MNHKAIATPSRTREILTKYGLHAKKSLGQNFLIDTNILERIVETAEIDNNTSVIEVGPGIGALTEFLAENAKNVLAFEIDQRFIPVLNEELGQYDNLTVIEQDVLEANLVETVETYLPHTERLVLAANLPYYITTPILMHFLHSDLKIDAMTVMMQKEVADRLAAKPSTKARGSLSLAVQYYMDVELAFIVPRTVFNPAPNIDSAIVKLTRREKPAVVVKNEDEFFALIRQSFVQRRKTLRNNLLAGLGKDEDVKEKLVEAFNISGIDPKRRGESLTLEEFGQLSDALVAHDIFLKQ